MSFNGQKYSSNNSINSFSEFHRKQEAGSWRNRRGKKNFAKTWNEIKWSIDTSGQSVFRMAVVSDGLRIEYFFHETYRKPMDKDFSSSPNEKSAVATETNRSMNVVRCNRTNVCRVSPLYNYNIPTQFYRSINSFQSIWYFSHRQMVKINIVRCACPYTTFVAPLPTPTNCACTGRKMKREREREQMNWTVLVCWSVHARVRGCDEHNERTDECLKGFSIAFN